MRNFTVYLVLLLCLFVSEIKAQETFDQAWEKFRVQQSEIRKEEEEIFTEEVERLRDKLKNRLISKDEFKEQKIVLENNKEKNIYAIDSINIKIIRQQFPELGEKTFEGRAEQISIGIKMDVYEEKKMLKREIDAVDKELINGKISKEQAEEKKLKLAEIRAKNIEEKVKIHQKALDKLIQDDIDGKIHKQFGNRNRVTMPLKNVQNSNIGHHRDLVLPAMKYYKGQKDKDSQQNQRTSTQLVFAIGANNLVTDKAIANSDFKYWGSRFYEWGLTYNTRIFKNDNLLHAKYGLSVVYNNLRPTDNRNFVTNDNQTNLVVNPVDLKDSRFRNVNLVFPIHLEFDFTKPEIKNDKTYFKSHNSFRLGIGGYFGTNLKSKQIIKYDLDGYKTVDRTRGDFNATNFIYGLSTYVGYKATSLYLKYDLNPLFKDNLVKQNNVSLGLRFDFN
ncbi:hypothetical protein [Flavobacterium undicola]|uniref:hypothetical protein n=1 Tax=Flavobacterium undicola TaxID=1932779 RepID=UPI001A9B6023|nr:hypothetical protein [Flavobacterium undicola]